jgi:hypothetical protein
METDAALLVEWIQGEKLSDILFGLGCTKGNAYSLVEQAAIWLRSFHAARSLPFGMLDTDLKLHKIEGMYNDRLVNDKTFKRGFSVLTASAKPASEVETPRSCGHGDFTTDNLIMSNGAVVGIDIHDINDGLVIEDIAQFFNQMEIDMRLWKSPQLRHHRYALFRIFMDTYLAGSGVSLERISFPLTWIRTYTLLKGWHNLYIKKRGLAHKFFLEKVYRSATDIVLRDLENFG